MRCASLYVHFPFCKSKCAYCGFFSVPAKDILDEYIAAVENETRFYAECYNIDCWRTIYLGGGTPSLMSARQIERVIRSLKKTACAKETEEITIEANPESLTEEKLDAASSAAVTRLSLGIQSLSAGALKTSRRACGVRECLDALELARLKWKGDLCVDAISGLPGQTRKEAERSFLRLLSFCPDHVSLYSLEIEEDTPFDRMIKDGKITFDEDEADSQWLWGRETLLRHGFDQYEVSNFCREGKVSLHNLSYWRQKDYVGVGSGAVGTFYGVGDKNSLRWCNTHDLSEYIAFWKEERHPDQTRQEEIPRDVELIDLKMREIEFLMMGLRTAQGVSEIDYKSAFSSLPPCYGDLAKRFFPLVRSGVACFSVKGGEGGCKTWALKGEQLLFLNRVVLALMD